MGWWGGGGLWEIVVSAAVEGRRSRVDLVTPPAFPTKSDQRLKVESMCTSQQVYSRFQFNLLLNCPLCSRSCPQTLRCILMPIRSVRLTAKGRRRGGGQHYLISGPLSLWSLRNTLERKGEKYILQPFDEQ